MHPSDKWLKVAFIAMLALRFFYPFYDNPLNHIFSDPGRHWENGGRLFDPTLMGSIDAKLYQVWIWLVRFASQDSYFGVAQFTGVLCAALPWLWYRTCREILPKRPSYIFALIIGLCPMFLLIYAYFMTETLMLDMLALAFWLTFRAVRKKNLSAYILVGGIWVLCCFTRNTAIPLAILATGYLLYHASRPWLLAFGMAAIFVVCIIPAGLHSYKVLRIFSPFQFDGLARLTFLADTQTYEVRTDKGWYGFSSPAFYHPPFYPLSFYSTRPEGVTVFTIDTKNGAADWDIAIENAKRQQGGWVMASNMLENAIFFVFGPSWPDTSLNDPYLLLRLNYHMHWLWPFLMVALALKAPRYRLSEPQAFILLVTMTLMVLMLIQPVGLMEGRYRKPLEPLLLLSFFMILIRPSRQEGVSIFELGMRTYVRPLIRLVKRT